ncbi:hypothetical protein AB1282_00515 [Gottfriedia sp. S16(2024)]|uniref:hypothetical protein n=1 Tax=Gottfriedia sp. S16(2024) TaxID=3162883 RepID=UPI003D24176C
MGVDFYACNNCGDTFPDCGDFTGCECGTRWCCDECAETEGYRHEEDGYTPPGSEWEQETSCNFCRNEDFEDYDLLTFAIGKLGLSREDLIKLYTENNQ